ncbi:MAG TPA: nucleotidyl transferase AbiEii/AbiGii toxin family protein [Candidatus Paceibacterota bacterium]
MHEEALTKQAATLFPLFSKFKGFYLVGGTALALQIGHRLSVDFDLFSSEKLPPNLLGQVKRVFSNSSIVVTYRAPEQLNLLIDNIQTTFFHYEYPVVNPFTEYKGVPLVSIQEIAAMKAFAVGKRLAYKDYIDWYFMLKEEYVTLQEVISLCTQKFGNDFNDRLFLGQLVFMEDIPTQKIDFLRDPVGREKIQAFLEVLVRHFEL